MRKKKPKPTDPVHDRIPQRPGAQFSRTVTLSTSKRKRFPIKKCAVIHRPNKTSPTNLLVPAGHGRIDVVRQSEYVTLVLHHPKPQSLAHPSRKPPTDREAGLGGSVAVTCAKHSSANAHCGRETTRHLAFTHTFVDPLTQMVHQHNTAITHLMEFRASTGKH